jgi:hypothetical protein
LCPTWKALNVLQYTLESSKSELYKYILSRIKFQTIAKFFSYRQSCDLKIPTFPHININIIVSENNKKEICIPNRYIIIIDEISMLSKKYVLSLKNFETNFALKQEKLYRIFNNDNRSDYTEGFHSNDSKNIYETNKMIMNNKIHNNKNNILQFIKNIRLKIILMGDRCQLPPIGNPLTISESFKLPSDTSLVRLTHLHRFENDSTKQLATICRKAVINSENTRNSYQLLHHLIGNIKQIADENITIVQRKKHFIELYENLKDKKSCYIITTRNKTAHYYNKVIQSHIRTVESCHPYKVDSKLFLPREKVMFIKTYTYYDSNGLTRCFQGQPYTICSLDIDKTMTLFGNSIKTTRYTIIDGDNITYYVYQANDKELVERMYSEKKEYVYTMYQANYKFGQLNIYIYLSDLYRSIRRLCSYTNLNPATCLSELQKLMKKNDSVNDSVYYSKIFAKTIGCTDANLKLYVKELIETRAINNPYISIDFETIKKFRNKISSKLWSKKQKYLAQLKFAHAINSYQCQGDTMDSTFIDLNDIMSCSFSPKKTLHELYTVASRAEYKVTILYSR